MLPPSSSLMAMLTCVAALTAPVAPAALTSLMFLPNSVSTEVWPGVMKSPGFCTGSMSFGAPSTIWYCFRLLGSASIG
jgi:hypothetical protein